MDLTEFATPQLHQSGRNFHVSHGDDNEAFVTFYDQPIVNETQSSMAGHPVYINAHFVSIEFPGDKTKKIVRPAEESDKQRWPRAYEAYLNKTETAVDGWRLEDWPVLTRADVENLKQYRIYTVEQLASISDANVTGLGLGVATFKAKAQAALQQAMDGSAVTRLQAENERLKLEIERLSRQVDELGSLRPATSSADMHDMIQEAVLKQISQLRTS
jgi:hypothetical protein